MIDATEEEMAAVRAFQMVKGKLTSFAAFFGAGVEYGEGVQKEKDAKQRDLLLEALTGLIKVVRTSGITITFTIKDEIMVAERAIEEVDQEVK